MKKLVLFSFLFAFLISCEEFEQDNPRSSQSYDDIGKLFKIKETTDQVGILSQFQVNQINVKNENQSFEYTFDSKSTLRIGGVDFELTSLTFKLSDGKFYLHGNEDTSFIFSENGVPSIFHNGKIAVLTKYSESFMNSDSDILLLAYFELTSPEISRKQIRKENSENMLKAPCSFVNTYYLTAVNISTSTAVAELESAMESGNYNAGCSLIGGMDVSCVTDSHMCVATQAYCCN